MSEGWLQFGLADALDVALAATALYAVLHWLRRSSASLVALGFGLLAAVYLCAGALELQLTSFLFRGLFGAGAVALVVVFQEELRQAFEELAAWAVGRRADHRPRLDSVDVLVQAITDLARPKTGALLVLAGLQKLDRHLHGGFELHGRLSAPLLASIFDASSDGHDGAVVLEDRSVTRFGAHLPLSRNIDALRGGGTRHAAALGLSERTDALCLVVSEERGSVSCAHAGSLREVRSRSELAELMQQFYRHRRALAAPRPLLRGVLDQPLEKLACLGAALGLWWVGSWVGLG